MKRKQVRLKLTNQLVAQLSQAAKESGRTMNGEIAERLQNSLEWQTIHELELLLVDMKIAAEVYKR